MKPYHLCSKRHQRRRREQSEFLLKMASIYPGDPQGTLAKEAAKLVGEEYEHVEFIVTITKKDGSQETYKNII